MKRKLTAVWLALALLLTACGAEKSAPPLPERESAARAESAEEPPQDFILGMDVSSVLAEEAAGVRYRGLDGEERDLFLILADSGFTHVRVRVWNDPHDAQGRGYGGGNCDAAAAAELGRRAAQAGLKLIVDFHYSDFWADPGKQRAPKAWEGLSAGEKAEALYAYTKDSLRRILEAGGEVDVVQLGNEINGGLCGESDWACVGLLLDAGSRAVRELCPGARIALHFTDPQREGAYRRYAETLEALGADYDLFASSYYPCWHGTLDELTAALSEAAAASGRQVMVMETAYPYTEADSDFFANTLGADAGEYRPFPYTVEGQAAAVRSVLDAVRRTEGGAGVCCWEGAWIAAGGASYEENRAKWERFGCGWAAGAAGEYDPDAANAPGGCAVDNQAFFGPDGRALESLKLFGEFQNGV